MTDAEYKLKMHAIKKYNHFLFLLQFLLGVGLSMGISSCGGTTDFLASAFIPNARGYVKVRTDRQEQYIVKVNLKNLIPLPEPTSNTSSYVVWMVSDMGITKNIGVLQTSTLFFTNIHRTTFRLESPIRPTRIFITAEDNPGIPFSNTEIVFSTSTFRD
jgi:hypothetical protein